MKTIAISLTMLTAIAVATPSFASNVSLANRLTAALAADAGSDKLDDVKTKSDPKSKGPKSSQSPK